MIKSLRVILWNEEIGRLAWDERRKLSYFTYNPEFVKKGLNVSPLIAPLNGVRALTPIWGEEAKIYQKLPAFVADSYLIPGVINYLNSGASRITLQM